MNTKNQIDDLLYGYGFRRYEHSKKRAGSLNTKQMAHQDSLLLNKE